MILQQRAQRPYMAIGYAKEIVFKKKGEEGEKAVVGALDFASDDRNGCFREK